MGLWLRRLRHGLPKDRHHVGLGPRSVRTVRSCRIWIMEVHFNFYLQKKCVCAFGAEVSKTIDMYAFLFNDILLLTKIKKPPRKVCSFAFNLSFSSSSLSQLSFSPCLPQSSYDITFYAGSDTLYFVCASHFYPTLMLIFSFPYVQLWPPRDLKQCRPTLLNGTS